MTAIRFLLAAALVATATPAVAQTTSGVPPAIWSQVVALGPVVDTAGVDKIYAQLRAQMPKDGVKTTLDIAYGSDTREKLDVYEPVTPPAKPAPVLIFVHGGAFIGGDKARYDNIGYYFARHGVIAVLPNYRLAPAFQWPAGVQDIAAAVKWTHDNVAAHGGDPAHVVLFGHSAGASHVAAYALEKRFQPAGGSGLAGVVLGSGLYDPSLDTLIVGAPPNGPDAAYYGADRAAYPEKSTVLHADAPKLPALIFEVEYDPLAMVVAGGGLYNQLCHRDHGCPLMYRFLNHDHISAVAAINTGDETVSGPILDFIRAH